MTTQLKISHVTSNPHHLAEVVTGPGQVQVIRPGEEVIVTVWDGHEVAIREGQRVEQAEAKAVASTDPAADKGIDS